MTGATPGISDRFGQLLENPVDGVQTLRRALYDIGT